MKNKKSEENFTLFVAERKGFEPPVLERVQRFSRPPHSTTLASLLIICAKVVKKNEKKLLFLIYFLKKLLPDWHIFPIVFVSS